MAKIEKTDEQWRAELTAEEYAVCRQHGTERAFSGTYYACKTSGTYHCKCCGEPLFSSDQKYDSGTGWPSFWQPVETGHVVAYDDTSHGMTRTEVRCQTCDAHLGHVFPDGPQPTGERYCINSVAVRLHPSDGPDDAGDA